MAGPAFDQASLVEPEHALQGLRRVEVALTQTCNLACNYCDIAHNLAQPIKGPMDGSLLDSIAQFADEHCADDGVEVVLTGGEPLSYWNTLIRAVTTFTDTLGERLREVRVLTNGTLVRPDRAAWFAEHGVRVTVAVDGLQPAHDAYRCNAAGIGSWRRATDAVSTLVDAGIVPDISMVVTADTVREAADSIDWICQTLAPGSLALSAAAPRNVKELASRPEPEEWAGLIVAAHDRWRHRGTLIEPVAEVAEALRTGIPLLHSDDGAWGGSIAVDVHGNAGPSLPLLSAGIAAVALESADLDRGVFQEWRRRSPAHYPACSGCAALGLCGNASMYLSTAAGGTPASHDPWHCRSQRHLVSLLAN